VQFSVIFKNWKSVFAGFSFQTDGTLEFSADLAKSECPTEFTEVDSSSKTCIILPLEEVAVVAALAALQVYVRSNEYNGTFSCAVVNDLLASTGLAVGRSRMPGSISHSGVEKILSPTSHCGVGLADILVFLQDWVDHGKVLHMQLPRDWVVPDAPMVKAWPEFFTSTAGALLLGRSQIGAILAGAADCEIYVTDAGIRTGARSDGCAFIEMSCLFSAARLASKADLSVSPLALGCKRRYNFEM
jgi:hypothetical protein